MKEVLAAIRMNKINQTKKALVDAGFPAFSAMRASGRGSRAVNLSVLEAIRDTPNLSSDELATISQGGRLFPKRLVSMVVTDAKVPELVNLLIKVNQTGTAGDGKIFVLPVTEVFRVRTGETGEEAIDEMTG
ncbi:MAG: P-II family nitrogen regulator [Deltaproteobacteria bacterium]|nr:P-II family nitrogen regulator [Deltaproteobacteria bacterium]